jgi:hypothetical protein
MSKFQSVQFDLCFNLKYVPFEIYSNLNLINLILFKFESVKIQICLKLKLFII